MRTLVIMIFLFAHTVYAAENKKMKWYAGGGPAFSNSLPGSTSGSKFSLSVGPNFQISEKADFKVFYEGTFSSNNSGSSMTGLNGGFNLFVSDRGADRSAFFDLAIGYGNPNRNSDGGVVAGGGIGLQVFRKTEYVLEIMYRHRILASASVRGISAFPSIDQILVGIYF